MKPADINIGLELHDLVVLLSHVMPTEEQIGEATEQWKMIRLTWLRILLAADLTEDEVRANAEASWTRAVRNVESPETGGKLQ